MTRPRAHRAGAGLLALLFTTLALWAPAPAAQAHTDLEAARPADGARLDRLPAEARLRFTEELSTAELVVRANGGVLPVAKVPGQVADFAVDLGSLDPTASVELRWQILDAHDGHVSEGTLAFRVRSQGTGDRADADPGDDGSVAPDAGPPSEPRLIGPAEVTARIVGYLAMAVLVGGLFFVSLLWPAGAQETRTRIVLLASVVAGAASAVADVAITLWRSAGTLTLRMILTEDFGRAHASMVLLWLLAAVIVVGVVQGGADGVRRLPWRIGALVVGAGLIRVTGMNAHASQGPDPTWGEVADFLHLAGVSAWVGGLVVLTVGVLPRRRLDELEEVVPRFSRVAQVAVVLIVASGLIMVWQLIRPIDDIFATYYSRVLLVKLGLFVLVLTAAMASKRWVDHTLSGVVAARRGDAVRSITASVAAETVLVAGVLGAASVLATSSPGV